MTLFKSGLLAIAFSTTLFTACKRKDESPAPANDKESLLTAKEWIITASTSTFQYNGMSQEIDVYQNMENCDKDNRYRFQTNKKMIVSEGATKCKDDAPDETDAGNWEFLQDNQKIRLRDSTGEEQVFDVVSLSADMFTIKGQADVPIGGISIPVVLEITYRHP